jgi:hypothetical protein
MLLHELPEPEDFGPKEVFAFYGLAAYHAQVLEQELLIFPMILHRSGRSHLMQADLDGLFANLEKRTLGQLLREAAGMTRVPDDVAGQLEVALDRRNYLVHRFFEKHSEDFISERGRTEMIEELRELTALFQRTDAAVLAVREPLAENLGITRELADRLFKAMIARAAARDDDK